MIEKIRNDTTENTAAATAVAVVLVVAVIVVAVELVVVVAVVPSNSIKIVENLMASIFKLMKHWRSLKKKK